MKLHWSTQLIVMDICPTAPADAQKYVDQITGYVLWAVGILFVVAVVVAVGAIVAGRLFSMPHASKVGVISIVVVFIAAIGYLVLPGMLSAVMGSGCISTGNVPAPAASASQP